MIFMSVVKRDPSQLKKIEKKAVDAAKKIVYTATNYVRNEAVQSIVRNPRRGPEVVRYNPRRTVKVSAPGDPPASDTGNLATLISSEIDGDGLGGKAISRADYSKALEYGTSKMEARPFMQPAAEKARPLIKRELKRLL